MSYWKEFSLYKKIIIGTFIFGAALVMPELMILLDVGGIDMTIGMIMVYYKPIIDWCRIQKQRLVENILLAKNIISESALVKPRVFAANALYCSLFIVVTGWSFVSFSFFVPALFINSI